MSLVQLSPLASALTTGAYPITQFASAAAHSELAIIEATYQPARICTADNHSVGSGSTTLLTTTEPPLALSRAGLQESARSALPQKIATLMLAGGLSACDPNASDIAVIGLGVSSAIAVLYGATQVLLPELKFVQRIKEKRRLKAALDANPTLDQALILKRSVRSAKVFEAFWNDAWQKGLIKTPDDFLALTKFIIPNPSDAYRIAVDYFVYTHLDEFFALLPNLEQVKALEADKACYIKTSVPIMEQAFAAGLIQTPDDFLALTEYIIPNPSKDYIYAVDRFVLRHLDAYFALQPSLEQVRALDADRVDYLDTHIAIKENALAAGLVQTPDDFLALTKYRNPAPSDDYIYAVDRFVITHLNEFFAMQPNLEQVKALDTDRAYYADTHSEIMERGFDAGLVQTPDDFVALTKYKIPYPNDDYSIAVDHFVKTHLDEFFALQPNLEQVKTLDTYRVCYAETHIAILEKAFAAGLVQSPDDFLTLTRYAFCDPSEAYRKAMVTFIIERLDRFLDLTPRIYHIQEVIRILKGAEGVETIVALLEGIESVMAFLTHSASDPEAIREALAEIQSIMTLLASSANVPEAILAAIAKEMKKYQYLS